LGIFTVFFGSRRTIAIDVSHTLLVLFSILSFVVLILGSSRRFIDVRGLR
jgi:Na+/proline symporter